jgi:hypothetical protein
MADYIDLIPAKPLSGDEIKVMERLRELAMKHEITFVTPKAGGYPVGEILSWVGSGEHSGRSNVKSFEFLKARNSGKPVVYVDWEASFDPNQVGFMIGSEKL